MLRGQRGRAVGIVGGVVVLVAAAGTARRGVRGGETRVFRSINGLPDRAFRPIWVPMQYGTFATVPILAAAAVARRRPGIGLALGASGTAAWYLAKMVKPLVGRGRPVSQLPGVHLRGNEEGDLGFPSGHAAVCTALTVVLSPGLPPAGRGALVGLCATVSLARLYVGAHLPLDVVGGSALGLVVGSVVTLVTAHPRPQD
jgi:undecaprenyl-diphosphatase